MKKFFIVLLAAGFLLGCSQSDQAANDSPAENKVAMEKPSETKTISVGVEGMTCQGCVSSIETAIAAVDGVVDQKVNLEGRSASITFDPSQTDAEKLAKVIGDAGYTVSVN